jgi:hypothetical protein
MRSDRTIIEGTRTQGIRETVAYTVTIPASWGTPASIVFAALDVTEGKVGNDVTDDVLTGDGSLVGNVATTPVISDLVLDHAYEIHGTITAGAQTLDFIIPLRATR